MCRLSTCQAAQFDSFGLVRRSPALIRSPIRSSTQVMPRLNRGSRIRQFRMNRSTVLLARTIRPPPVAMNSELPGSGVTSEIMPRTSRADPAIKRRIRMKSAFRSVSKPRARMASRRLHACYRDFSVTVNACVLLSKINSFAVYSISQALLYGPQMNNNRMPISKARET